MINCQCPKCKFAYELNSDAAGTKIRCRKCEREFDVPKDKDEETETYGVESVFKSEQWLESLLPAEQRVGKVDPDLEGWRNVLELPPPPREEWSPEDIDEATRARLVEFRRNTKAVQEFIDRDVDPGRSVLVIAGLIVMAGALVGVLFVVILLLFTWKP
jgi:hypothetical protein